MSRFLETDKREHQKYEKRTQTSVDDTVNDVRHEIKFKNHVQKKKKNFFMEKNIFSFLNKNMYF